MVAPSTIVDSVELMTSFLDTLVDLPTAPPSLYLDLEGVNLCRHGTLTIMQLFVAPQNHAYLIDVYVLGEAAFSTKGANGQTFKDILESKDIPKVFFDVRNDSDALYSHFGVHLSCVIDVQLMELATRDGDYKEYLRGLEKAATTDRILSPYEEMAFSLAKQWGKGLYDPKKEKGGNMEIWNQRPLPGDLVEYCVADVEVLPKMLTAYEVKLTGLWRPKVEEAMLARVEASQSEDYDPKGPNKAKGPWRGFEGPQWTTNYLDEYNETSHETTAGTSV